MESLKDIMKTKIGSVVAILFVVAYIGLYYFKDVNNLPMETMNAIIFTIVGYLFGAAKKENMINKDDK
jgi:hypothetical protein